jgi:phosphoribosylglycinamide formyltransferase-1
MEAAKSAPTGHEEFVCEEIVPAAGTFDTAGMSRGEPGLPARFVWRGHEYRVIGVVRQWKTSGPCRNGSPELYLRRHWYQILTEPRAMMTVYCDRQAKDRKKPKRRWWVYTVSDAGPSV